MSQLIYTSTGAIEITPQLCYQISLHNVKTCTQLGITGRVFANDRQAIGILEGQTDIVEPYFQALAADSLVESSFLHIERPIDAREFVDYCIWLNSSYEFEVSPQVRALTHSNLALALPENPSAKIRIMVETFLKPEVLGARDLAQV